MNNALNCDQVAWLKDALKRHAEAHALAMLYPSISRLASACKTAAIVEIMEIAGLCFLDDEAKSNAFTGLEAPMTDAPPSKGSEESNGN